MSFESSDDIGVQVQMVRMRSANYVKKIFFHEFQLTNDTFSISTLHEWQKNLCGGWTTKLSAIFSALFLVYNYSNWLFGNFRLVHAHNRSLSHHYTPTGFWSLSVYHQLACTLPVSATATTNAAAFGIELFYVHIYTYICAYMYIHISFSTQLKSTRVEMQLILTYRINECINQTQIKWFSGESFALLPMTRKVRSLFFSQFSLEFFFRLLNTLQESQRTFGWFQYVWRKTNTMTHETVIACFIFFDSSVFMNVGNSVFHHCFFVSIFSTFKIDRRRYVCRFRFARRGQLVLYSNFEWTFMEAERGGGGGQSSTFEWFGTELNAFRVGAHNSSESARFQWCTTSTRFSTSIIPA